MKIVFKYLLLIFLLLPLFSSGQQLNTIRFKQLQFNKQSIKIDTLSIIPLSIVLKDGSGNYISDSLYTVNLQHSIITLKNFNPEDSLQKYSIKYKVFPIDFSKKYANKNASILYPDESGLYNPFTFTPSERRNEDIFSLGGLNKSGSISRGLSFGNNQDVVVNSSLNLQMSGKISDDVEILAAITDNNVPIQPDGNTQQIQEFDKVFIQLSNKNNRLIAGDYELLGRDQYFLKYMKKAQGLTIQNISRASTDSNSGVFTTNASVAVSKGKYARNQIQGMEGNQGPYRLRGTENESYIIILAGTEKIYLDGRLLARGQDYDYVIDYNTAELSFTPKRIINKDSRIIAEFEYSDKSYTRSIMQAGTAYQSKRMKIKFNYLSEQDAKNQPIQQDLNDDKKLFLSEIGDSIGLALFPNVDSVAFNASEILYKLTDTTVNSIAYDSIYVFSINPDSARYRLGFSNVGPGKGNYVQLNTTANGKVYKWVAPVSGIPQGIFEPVVLLVTPKKQSMAVLSADFMVNKNLKTSLEIAMSTQDKNLFSPKDDKDNNGYAVKWGINYEKLLRKDSIKPLYFITSVANEIVEKRFNPIERYRSSEFSRDWNMGSNIELSNEVISELSLSLTNKKDQYLSYRLSDYNRGSLYNGLQNGLMLSYRKFGFKLLGNTSYVATKEPKMQSAFLRHNFTLSREIKSIEIGVKEESEQNKFLLNANDTLQSNSHYFNSVEAFVKSLDTAKLQFNTSYKRRWDYIPNYTSFSLVTYSEDIAGGIEKRANINTNIAVQGIYRKLYIADTLSTLLKPDETAVGRFEFRKRMLKGAVVSNTFYEIGTGMEQKKEYSYIEVAAGKGIYSWTDYNSNGLQELNEFDIAQYQDQANFIRIYTPTNNYIKAYTNMFNQILNLTPQLYSKSKSRAGQFISKFSTQSAYRIDRKTTGENLFNAFNPFLSAVEDTALVSLNSNLRNTLYINRNSSRFGVDINYQDNRNKILLTNGYESRTSLQNGIRFRYNFKRAVMLSLEGKEGKKTSKSDYFSTRDYNINYIEIQPQLDYQYGTNFRLSLIYRNSDKQNTISDKEKALLQSIGTEIRYNVATKGSFQARVNYVQIKFNGIENTPIGYEMLEGLKPGKNYTWNINYQRNISNNLQMNISYEGRKPDQVKTIHVGSVQFRAFF
ncbi:MAG: hypothetical protein WCK02_13210 [Bacteroidota bacterium]